ncbi:acyltransferase family protein [Buchananella felis]|uniref:acyltransferase family protein n=1 Tax=Buchananella felis TaxID=3231492 RepID=UPI003528F867
MQAKPIGAARNGKPSTSAGVPRSPGKRHLAPLDGLRALAIVFVLGYHFFPKLAPQGRLGVDLFFVLSGFLITSLLLAETQRSGRVNLRGFFLRRWRRLVPALVLAVVTVVGMAAVVGGDALLAVRRQTLGSLFFVSNWVEIFAGGSYYDHTQPLLLTNTWSLAIEAQFYMVWPLLLLGIVWLADRLIRAFPWAAHWQARRVAAVLCVLIAAASFGAGVALTSAGAAASRAYFGTDTHSFGLMLGAALALLNRSGLSSTARTSSVRATWRGVAGWVSVLLLVALSAGVLAGVPGLAWLVADTRGMGALLVASVLSVGVVQALLPSASSHPGPARWLQKVVGARALTWIGERSYGIYLWHWPLYVLLFYAARRVPSLWGALAVSLASVALAALSYKYVEEPVRNSGWRGAARRLFTMPHKAFLASGLAIVIVCSAFVWALAHQPAMSQAQASIEAGRRALATATPAAPASPPAAASASPSDDAAAPASASPEAPSEPAPSPSPVEPTPTPVPPISVPVQGADVAVVGDSVTLASAPSLAEQLVDSAIDAEVSRHFLSAQEILAGLDATYGQRPFVVVSLLSNGPVSLEEMEEFLASLAPGRRLVLVTAYGPETVEWMAPNNQVARQFAAAHKDRVRIADWDTAIAARTDLLADDLIHPSEEGGDVYAAAVQAALDSFATPAR